MGRIIAIVGPSGVGKTTLVRALEAAGDFAASYESHADRPFQSLFNLEARYALANQMDYLLHRAEEERVLRAGPLPGLVDGGLDLDFHGFTRLFHARGWLSEDEYDLCRRGYLLIRSLLPAPDLIVRLTASPEVVKRRLASRTRINLASGSDASRLDQYVAEWLESVPEPQKLTLDVSAEDVRYATSVKLILAAL